MGENRCRRCNRKLGDPNALYGWRCAQIMQKDGLLNYAGDNSFEAFIEGIRIADQYLLEYGIDPGKVDLSAFYQASIKCQLAKGMGNEKLMEEALAEAEQALMYPNLPLDQYIRMLNEQSIQRIDRNLPLEENIRMGNNIWLQRRTPSLSLEEYVRLRDNFDYQNGQFSTDRYLDGEFSTKVLAVQELLNSLGAANRFGDPLKEDGIFGPNTQWALDGIGMQIKGIGSALNNQSSNIRQRDTLPLNEYIRQRNKISLQRINPNLPLEENIRQWNNSGYQNIQFPMQELTDMLDNSMKFTESLNDLFIHSDDLADFTKKGGKAISVVGAVLDIYELGSTMYYDLNDEDGKIGKKTIEAAVGIVSELGGEILGSIGGTAVGTALSGGQPGPLSTIGGFVGGIFGSLIGKRYGEYILDEAYQGG